MRRESRRHLLQGPFAIGDPSRNSDIDVITALHRDYTEREIAQLQTLDLALYDELASREASGRCVVCEDKLGIGCCEVDGAIGGTPLG